MGKIRIFLIAVAAMTGMMVMAQDEKSIVEREYWFDNNVSTLQTLDATTNAVDISNLSQGLHAFSLRVKDSEGLWSSAMTKYFVKKPTPTSADVAACEYWFDNKVENRKPLSESVAVVDLTGLPQGLHAFTMRVKNDAGVWSSTMTKYFIVPAAAMIEGGLTVSRYLYWIDDDEVVTGTLSSQSDIIAIDISSVPDGEHTLSWMVGDSKGAWSQVYTETFVYDNPLMIKTGIDGVGTDDQEEETYDLQGRRVKTVKKGIYIINGKVVVK
jgi:hypothetical protein